MKIEEFKEMPPAEKTLKVKIVPKGKSISIVVVNDAGTALSAGYLLDITEKGIKLHPYVDAALGIPLDRDGKLVIVD